MLPQAHRGIRRKVTLATLVGVLVFSAVATISKALDLTSVSNTRVQEKW